MSALRRPVNLGPDRWGVQLIDQGPARARVLKGYAGSLAMPDPAEVRRAREREQKQAWRERMRDAA